MSTITGVSPFIKLLHKSIPQHRQHWFRTFPVAWLPFPTRRSSDLVENLSSALRRADMGGGSCQPSPACPLPSNFYISRFHSIGNIGFEHSLSLGYDRVAQFSRRSRKTSAQHLGPLIWEVVHVNHHRRVPVHQTFT